MMVERNGPKHVDELLDSVTKSYPRESWISLFGNSHDLATFFKLHSNIFHVQANIVDIVPYNMRRTTEPNLIESPTVKSPSSLPSISSQPDSFSPPPPQQQQSLKQRVSSILMKTLADNTGRDQRPPAQDTSPTHSLAPQREVTSPSKMRVLQSTRVVSTTKESITVVADILSGSHKVVAFDLEGVNIGSNNGEVYFTHTFIMGPL